MNKSPYREIESDRDQVLNAERLIEAVRGSQAARVLYELRPWLLTGDHIEDGTASGSSVPPNPSLTCTE